MLRCLENRGGGRRKEVVDVRTESPLLVAQQNCVSPRKRAKDRKRRVDFPQRDGIGGDCVVGW